MKGHRWKTLRGDRLYSGTVHGSDSEFWGGTVRPLISHFIRKWWNFTDVIRLETIKCSFYFFSCLSSSMRSQPDLHRTIERFPTTRKLFCDVFWGYVVIVFYGSFCFTGQRDNKLLCVKAHHWVILAEISHGIRAGGHLATSPSFHSFNRALNSLLLSIPQSARSYCTPLGQGTKIFDGDPILSDILKRITQDIY